jgi:hypothetical protein
VLGEGARQGSERVLAGLVTGCRRGDAAGCDKARGTRSSLARTRCREGCVDGPGDGARGVRGVWGHGGPGRDGAYLGREGWVEMGATFLVGLG